LTSGLDRVSLVDVMKDLRFRREKIWSTEPEQSSRLEELSQRRQKLLREIDELKQKSKRWSRLASESTDLLNQIKDLEKELNAKERESRLVEIAMQISERWAARHYLNDQILALGALPDEREISIAKLDEYKAKIAQTRERLGQIKLQRREIKKEAMALPINRALWLQKRRAEAITEHVPWIESLQRQSDRLQTELTNLDNSLVGEVDGLGTQLKIKAKDIRELNPRKLLDLEATGRKLEDQQEKLRRFQQEHEKVEFDLLQHQDRLGSSLAERGAGETIEEVTRYVNRLRRHVELEERIEKLNQSRHELERDIDSIVSEQVLPVGKLTVIGLVFIAGVVLLGFGLVDIFTGGTWLGDTTRNLGILFMFLGSIAGLMAMGMKYHWERMAKDELDDFRHQMDIVRQQLKRGKTEREEIERQLPTTITQYQIELKDAENRLSMMQELVPLENRVQATRSSSEELRRRTIAQEREVQLAKDQWQASLRTVGLPDELMPNQLKELSHRSERITALNLRRDQLNSEKLEKDKELAQIQVRIDDLFHDAGMEANDINLIERLNRLTRLINEQKALVIARKELVMKYRVLRSRATKTRVELEKLVGLRERLFAQAGVETEDAYRGIENQLRERKKLVEKRDAHSEQITIALGKNYQEKHLQTLMETYGSAGLEKRWEAIQQEIEKLKHQQTKLHQQRGEFIQEVKMLGEDSRMDVVRLELNALETEIANAQKEWQVLAASTQIFDLIRESYEAKRQPETLKEASSYLERLTAGKYVRIWTRLVGEELLVDNANGESLAVEKLSRGTRETVFLSLRMALVSAYARQGALIPLVLDDVLVNFDGQRAQSAAEVLRDFSKSGYQILMFTCHGHMRDMFFKLGADVRILPHHRDVYQNHAVPLIYQGPEPVTPKSPEPNEYLPVYESIPVEYAPAKISLDLEEYDPDLEYELSAVMSDQQEKKLRNDLVFYAPNYSKPLDLSGNDDLWWERRKTPVRH
jgi:uncharacterized protein YhaN